MTCPYLNISKAINPLRATVTLWQTVTVCFNTIITERVKFNLIFWVKYITKRIAEVDGFSDGWGGSWDGCEGRPAPHLPPHPSLYALISENTARNDQPPICHPTHQFPKRFVFCEFWNCAAKLRLQIVHGSIRFAVVGAQKKQEISLHLLPWEF